MFRKDNKLNLSCEDEILKIQMLLDYRWQWLEIIIAFLISGIGFSSSEDPSPSNGLDD
jgi:hypothetical protein